MVSYPPSSERQNSAKPGPGSGQGRLEKTPGTPRKDVRVVKERAVQLPELRDYVCSLLPRGRYIRLADTWLGPRRLFRQRGIRLGLQGSQSGDGRGRGHQADPAGGPAQERIADDRGTRTPSTIRDHN